MEITELNPKIVWKYFHEITQVPRPSKKEEKIIAYLEKFAKDHGIEYKKDKVGNIVMCKPATPGYEDRVKLILQSHVDMVCEKNAGTVHDFDNDPIRTIIDGEWLHADGTTLGADNGIGCAAQLAVLASDDIEHGPIEALFTIDEETGMTGAFALQPGFLTGKILINLDSETKVSSSSAVPAVRVSSLPSSPSTRLLLRISYGSVPPSLASRAVTLVVRSTSASATLIRSSRATSTLSRRTSLVPR